MEEILRKLQKEASGGKHKAIRDSCAVACGKMHLSVYSLLGIKQMRIKKPRDASSTYLNDALMSDNSNISVLSEHMRARLSRMFI